MIFVNEKDIEYQNSTTPNLLVKNIISNYHIKEGNITCGVSKWPHGKAGEIHTHAQQDEIFIVLEGEAKAYINGHYEIIKTGDIVYAKCGEKHGTVEGISKEGIKLFYALIPTGNRNDGD